MPFASVPGIGFRDLSIPTRAVIRLKYFKSINRGALID